MQSLQNSSTGWLVQSKRNSTYNIGNSSHESLSTDESTQKIPGLHSCRTVVLTGDTG